VALRSGEKIAWDAKAFKTGSPKADALLRRDYRAGWTLWSGYDRKSRGSGWHRQMELVGSVPARAYLQRRRQRPTASLQTPL